MLHMTVRHVATACAAAFSVLIAASAVAAPGDPAAFARELYSLPNLWGDLSADEISRERYLTPRLAALVAANNEIDEVNRIDYDPLTDSQEFEITDLEATTIEANDRNATVRVEFRNFGDAQTITLKLELVDGDWRLANILYDDERSLTDDLEYMNEAD